jgi:hypothetical protein
MELEFEVTNEVLIREENCSMKTNRVVALAAILCVALVCLAPTAMAGDMDGVMMKDGKMMMMKDGKAMGPMASDMTMSNGTKMMHDGTMMMKDGSKMQMKDGQMMMMDGKLMDGGKAIGMGNQ